MKIKLTALLLCLAMAISLLVAIPVGAEDDGIVKNGLVAWYDGVNNTGSGHNASATTWKDLSGNNNDITLTTNTTNKFTDNAFHLNKTKQKFPKAVMNAINGSEFTVELKLANVEPTEGKAFATLINNIRTDGTNSNDFFSLFYRTKGDFVEFKYQNEMTGRPKANSGLNYLNGSTIAITFKVGGSVCMYADGALIGQGSATHTIGADGDLYFGHDADNKAHIADYCSMRFYNRALSEKEILQNAGLDDFKVIDNGLVSYYDGENNTGSGHNASATTWKDLAGSNDINLTTNATNYFTDDAFLSTATKQYFPSALLNLINGKTFTMEITLGAFTRTGTDFATFINSDGNDKISLFLNASNDHIEFKSNNTQGTRPSASGGTEYFKNSTVSVTFRAAGTDSTDDQGSVCLYVDGVLISQVEAPSAINAEGSLFFGHNDPTRSHTTEYRSIRFYDRELNAAEIINNAKAYGTCVRPFANVQQPKTNIIGDVCVSSYVENQAGLTAALNAASKPANLIFYAKENLEVTDKSYANAYSTVETVVDTLDAKFIPTFYVKDVASAKAVANHLDRIGLTDAYIMSSDPAAVKAARQATPYIRGIIDYTGKYTSSSVTAEQLLEIRKTTISNLSHVAVIPQVLATQENVKYLNSRQITTWVAESDATTTEAGATSMLLSGAYGVIVKDYGLLFTSAAKHIKPNTLTRPPLIIGHRGIPGTMPENTMEGAIEAYNQGADVVEIDLYLSSDGIVVVNHDATTSKYNIKDLKVEEQTWAKLKTLTYTHGGKTYYMPTLEDFMKEFHGKELMLFLEIKSKNTKIVQKIKDLVEKYNMYSQCAIIIFGEIPQLNMLKSVYPEMPVGYLTGTAYTNTNFPNIQKTIQTHNTTYNPTYSGYNADYVRYSVMRGVTTWPWTINNKADIMSNINYGHAGITTDHCDYTKNMTIDLKINLDKLTDYEPDSVVDLTATKSTYGGASTAASPEYILLGGSDVATLSNGKLTFKGNGSVTLAAVISETCNGMSYSIYSQPLTLSAGVVEEPEQPDDNPDDNNTPNKNEPDGSDASNTAPESETVVIVPGETGAATDNLPPVKKKGGCGSAVAAATVVIGLVTTLGAALLVKKKD